MFRNSFKIFPPRFPWLFVLFLLAFQLSPEHANGTEGHRDIFEMNCVLI